ncbi:MAG: TlpA family protein disulfide reductase [Candidatus Omnitrophica bacterium]|nr:TlpA family protein disulfide reductase [Candidatus Omnitrophota bacterium]
MSQRRSYCMFGWIFVILIGFFSRGAMAGEISEERIRLTDGAEFSGSIVDRSSQYMVILVPRSKIATVDGKALPPPVVEGSEAPDFNVVDLQDRKHTIKESQGQTTLLQFWASWCPYCRTDVALMKSMAQQYEEKGLRILSIAIDDHVDTLRQFVEKEGIAYPVIAASAQKGYKPQDLSNLYEARGVPNYFLIDPSGVIRHVHYGAATPQATEEEQPDSQESLEEALARLMKPEETTKSP